MAEKTTVDGYKNESTRKALKNYTYLGCPMTKNRTAWCFRLCIPDSDGTGFCGRVAPHGITSRIQQGIEDFSKTQDESA